MSTGLWIAAWLGTALVAGLAFGALLHHRGHPAPWKEEA